MNERCIENFKISQGEKKKKRDELVQWTIIKKEKKKKKLECWRSKEKAHDGNE